MRPIERLRALGQQHVAMWKAAGRVWPADRPVPREAPPGWTHDTIKSGKRKGQPTLRWTGDGGSRVAAKPEAAEEAAPAPVTGFTRDQKLTLIYRDAHKDFKGRSADGTRRVMVFREGGSQSVPLEMLTDAEVERLMPDDRAKRLTEQQAAKRTAKKKASADAPPKAPPPAPPPAPPRRPSKADDEWTPPDEPFASPDEIDERVAAAAHQGTSWSPEVRGARARSDYAQELNQHFEAMHKLARTPEEHAAVDEHLAETKERFRTAYNAYLSAQSRTTSWAITGRSGRNEAREQKKFGAVDRNREGVLGVLPASEEALKRKLKAMRTEEAGGPLGEAKQKLAELQYMQHAMKEANKVVRNKRMSQDQKVARIIELTNVSEERARSLLTGDEVGRIGFPPYAINNNNAEIRRMTERVAELERREGARQEAGGRTKQMEFTGSEAFPFGGSVEIDHEEQRIRLRFNQRLPKEKFQELVRTTGFNWSREYNAFSHVLGERGLATTRRITGADVKG